MYQPHPSFVSPQADAVLWRYMDFTRFVSLLDQKALWFASVDTLGDPFEGSNSLDDTRDAIMGYTDLRYTRASPRSEEWRHFTLVNCWSQSEEESDALWKIYASTNGGVSIQTTFDSLCGSLVGAEDVYIGVVHYMDYHSERIPQDNHFNFYLRKRLAFKHEQEVRAIHHFPGVFSPTTSKWERDLSLQGIYIRVDVAKLVSQVVVAPFAPDWLLGLTRSVARQYGYTFPVQRSHLSQVPF